MWNPSSIAALPTGTNVRPEDPSTWTYGNEPGVVGYVLGFNNSRRFFTSYGKLPEFTLGSYHDFHSDQTGRTLGFWKVVGIVTRLEDTHDEHFTTTNRAAFSGDCSTRRKVSHWVCK